MQTARVVGVVKSQNQALEGWCSLVLSNVVGLADRLRTATVFKIEAQRILMKCNETGSKRKHVLCI